MRIINWNFKNLNVPMIEDDESKLWCTNKSLAEALQTTEANIRWLALKHRDRLNALSVCDTNAKEFIKLNKVRLGLKRIKKDMVLWSETQMIRIALWSRSEVADDFTDEIVDMVRKQARVGYATIEDMNKLKLQVAEMSQTLGQIVVENENLKKALVKPEVRLRLIQ